MKKILFFMLAAGLFTACGDKAGNDETAQNDSTAVVKTEETAEANGDFPDPDATGKFGAEISEEGAVAVTEIPALLKGKDSVFVKVQGEIAACCQKKGCWMTMPMGNEELMVRFKDYGFFVPMNSAGKNTVLEGWAFREEISVDELRHYAEDEGQSKEEIAKITAPETKFTFLADGVIVASK